MDKNYLLYLLKALEAALPPPNLCHHAITCAQFGSDTDGWTDKLALQINLGGVWTCFFLEQDDLDKPIGVLVGEIRQMLIELKPNAQFGVGMGQFVE